MAAGGHAGTSVAAAAAAGHAKCIPGAAAAAAARWAAVAAGTDAGQAAAVGTAARRPGSSGCRYRPAQALSGCCCTMQVQACVRRPGQGRGVHVGLICWQRVRRRLARGGGEQQVSCRWWCITHLLPATPTPGYGTRGGGVF